MLCCDLHVPTRTQSIAVPRPIQLQCLASLVMAAFGAVASSGTFRSIEVNSSEAENAMGPLQMDSSFMEFGHRGKVLPSSGKAGVVHSGSARS